MYQNDKQQHTGLTDLQCEQLVEQVRKHSLLLGAMVELVLETGSRPKELLALTWGDLDSASKTVGIRDVKQLTTRVLPLSENLVQLLLDIQPLIAGPTEAMFTAEQASDAYTQLRIAAGEIGVPEIRWNDLRIRFIAKLLDSGLAAKDVLDRGGWEAVNLLKRKIT